MTDKEALTAMLDRAGVFWNEATPGTISIDADETTPHNLGYRGFFTEFIFMPDGQLLSVGSWE